MHKYSNIIINNLGQFKRMVMEKILNYKLHEPDLDQQEIDRKVEIYKKFLS